MTMDKKQSVMLVLTILAFLFLGYQVYQLVSNDMQEPTQSAPQPVVQMQSEALPLAHNAVGSEAHYTQTVVEHGIGAAHGSLDRSQSSMGVQLPSRSSAKNQQEYLKLVNQFELAKMQRQLLQEQAAIARARHEIVVMNNQTSKISGSDVSAVGSSVNLGAVGANNSDPFQLGYLDYQHGSWTAALVRDGRYLNVQPGTLLPGGVKIIAINHKGVIINDKKDRELVSFNGTIALPKMMAVNTKKATVNPGQIKTLAANEKTAASSTVLPVVKKAQKDKKSSSKFSLFSLIKGKKPAAPVSEPHPSHTLSKALSLNVKSNDTEASKNTAAKKTVITKVAEVNEKAVGLKEVAVKKHTNVELKKPIAAAKKHEETQSKASVVASKKTENIKAKAVANNKSKSIVLKKQLIASKKPKNTELKTPVVASEKSKSTELNTPVIASKKTKNIELKTQAATIEKQESTVLKTQAASIKNKTAINTKKIATTMSHQIHKRTVTTAMAHKIVGLTHVEHSEAQTANVGLNMSHKEKTAPRSQWQLESRTSLSPKQPLSQTSVGIEIHKMPAISRFARLSASELEIMNTPEDHYTIQLMGSENLVNMRSFIKKHGLDNQALLMQVNNHGKAWYMLVLGNYSSINTAEQALSAMPASLQAGHPWVRRYGALQYALTNQSS